MSQITTHFLIPTPSGLLQYWWCQFLVLICDAGSSNSLKLVVMFQDLIVKIMFVVEHLFSMLLVDKSKNDENSDTAYGKLVGYESSNINFFQIVN